MTKVLVTGARGAIGSVVAEGLSRKHEVVGLDLPDSDISNYDFLLGQMQDVDTVVHVAHSASELNRENWRSGKIDPNNVLLEMNVFNAALEAGIGRLVMASSVHADNFMQYEGEDLLTVPGSLQPTSPYGAHKIIVEEMGRFYANHSDLEFVGIRFGGVTPDNSVKTFGKESLVWLSHNDLSGVVEASVDAQEVPGKFAVFYAVSDNNDRIHSTENPFGWQPHDNSADYLPQSEPV